MSGGEINSSYDNCEEMSESTVWRLEKYARYVPKKAGSLAGFWQSHDGSEDSGLVMTLTDTKHLVVLRGSVVLESHSLVTARAWMRGMSKNDSLLFLYKHGKGTRRFKVKFADVEEKTGNQVCEEATVKLSTLFSIHVATPPVSTPPTQGTGQQEKSSETTGEKSSNNTLLQGDVSLASMTQIILGGSTKQLPATYTMTSAQGDAVGMTSLPDDVMANHLRLFLTDPTFPAFVAKVSQQLEDIMKECQE